MIYNIKDKVPFGKLIVFGLQLMLSVFVATVLIANICGVAVSGALVGAGLATIVYLIITGFNSPMFMSNSGAFVAPVMIALATGGYTAVAIGGLTTCIVYYLFGLLFTKIDVANIYKLFPKALIGAITVVIGVTLMGFIGTYVQIGGAENIWGIVVAFFTAAVIALLSFYSKGIVKILPFLIGTLAGYALSVVLTLCGVANIVDFSVFKNIGFIQSADFALMHWMPITFKTVLPVIVIYIAFTVSAMMECLSDHAVLSTVVGKDLYVEPGLSSIFMGEGFANLVGSVFGGLGICSYGEGVACVGFSKVASTMVTLTAAVMLIILGYLAPVQAFIASIPSCVFGGCAIILYGYIASSGIRTLQSVDLGNQKNLIIVSSVVCIGISGIAIGGASYAISGTALALIAGVVLNIILKEKELA